MSVTASTADDTVLSTAAIGRITAERRQVLSLIERDSLVDRTAAEAIVH
jgi:hypothetical protein